MTTQVRQATILPDLTSKVDALRAVINPDHPALTVDVSAELARLRAENEALKAAKAASSVVRFKVSEKGAFSIYGMGRFPFTFYLSQWDAFVMHFEAAKAFVALNRSKFATKPIK